MQIGICSYSFHGLLAAGKQDIFQFILDCKALGCTQLDPWNSHLAPIREADKAVTATSPGKLSSEEIEYVERIAAAGRAAGLPFGNIAVDGAHIYEPTPEARAVNRARAYRWLDVARRLKAAQIRIDAGGPEDMPADAFAIIKQGYADLISRGKSDGIEIVVENHWGPTNVPDNVIKLLENVPGLGYLFDSYNWKPAVKAEARVKCARYATAVHIKTLNWDEQGNEVGEDVPSVVKLLKDAKYKGVWGIESTPVDGAEMESARKAVALLRRLVPA